MAPRPRDPRDGRVLRHRIAAVVLGMIMPVALLATPASAVNADHGNRVVSQSPAAFTPQVMNGSVNAITQVGNRIVAAGTFTTVRQTPTSADITRNGIFAFDAATGAIDTGFNPNLGGSANSLDTDGSNVYVGGSFGSVGGNTAVRRVVKLTASGAVVPTFNAVPNSFVSEVVVRGSRLYVGGGFTSIRSGTVTTPRSALAALDTTSGAVLGAVDVPFTGLYNGGGTNIKRFDVSADGTKLAAVGNFTTVAGQPREQLAVVDLPATGQASVSSWTTDRFSQARNGCAAVFDTFMRDVDFAPDGSWFVVTTTGAFAGGAGSGTLCDTITRWETGSTGNDPTWVDYSGGDTIYGVAITGSAVYVGGHMRWMNNSFQGDQAGPGAVPRDGIAALDPVNGLPLAWNPGRTRGVGAQALFATPQGLWVGSDTTRIGGQLRQRIALMPLAGGSTVAPVSEPTLPNDVFAAQRSATGTTNVLYRVNAGGGPLQSGDSGPDWSSDAGFVSGGNTANWGTTVPVDTTVPTGTAPDIFATERWSGQDYNFAVPNGKDVTVRLYFANQCGCTSAAGQRVFDVLVDDVLRLDDFDIVAAAGDKRGTMRSFSVTSDGNVDIDLRNVVENPLVNGIEIIDNTVTPPGGTAPNAPLVRRGLAASATPTGTSAVANTAMDWSAVRGAALVGGTLYYGRADGSLYKRTLNPATGATGTESAVNLYDDPEDGGRIPFAIANLSGMVYDASTHRLYYTLFGDSRLFFRYFTPNSEVVGAQTFTAPSNGIDFSSAAGLAIASGRLLYGSRDDGALRSVPFTAGAIAGAPSVVSSDGSWRYRDMFMSTTSTQPPPANVAPTARFTASCTERACSFDAGASTDSDGTIAGYGWTFGDEASGSGRATQHSYTADGTYTVTLTVTDNQGATGTTTRIVTVAQAPPVNQAPTAAFTASCTERACSFDATTSADPDGSITAYAWTFGDTTNGTGQTTQHTYTADGTYPVTLTVTDNQGATGTATRQVSATQQPPPPVGTIGFRSATSTNGNLVTTRLTVPAGVQTGDAIVLSLTQNAARNVSAPAGLGTWTDHGTQVGDLDQIRTTTWTKVAQPGDAGKTVSVTLSARAKVTLSLAAYSGTSTTAPVHSYTARSETALTAAHTTPAATGVPAGSWIVSGWSDKTSATTSWTDPAGTTQRVEEIGTAAGRITTQLSDTGPLTAGNHPGLTATATPTSTSRKAIMWTLVLKP